MAQQADRFRLGRAALAEGLVRPRPAGAVQCRGRRGVRAASAPSASPRPASARWRPRPSSRTAPTCIRRSSCAASSPARTPGASCSASRAAARTWPARSRAPTCKGNKWVVNGQKVWTTSAHKADWGLLLARTDWDEPKHKGLSYFVLDMSQPGVEVQPLKQMNGHASFNQVFFTDAEVEPEMHGRRRRRRLDGRDHDADARAARRRRPAHAGRMASDRARAASTRRSAPRSPRRWSPTSGIRSAPAGSTWCCSARKETGKINDPVVRQEIAKLLIMSKSAEWTARRARAAQEQGRPQGPEGSLGKLVASHVARAAARVHTYDHRRRRAADRRGRPDGRA